MSIINELKRRNVLRVGTAYLAGAWLLVQLVNEIFPLFGVTEAAGRFVVILLAIGFVPTLVLSWVFELTPEGLKRESIVDHAQPDEVQSTRRFDRAIMVLLALAVVLFAVDRFMLDPVRDARMLESATEQARTDARLESFGDRSIAVLAFEDLSPEGDQEYFAEGISEELLNLLAKIPELRVAARTSAFSFKNQVVTIAEIAEALDVAHVLEGSVRRAGDQLRITALLIDAQTDTHLWSETYNRQMGDVFAIQDEIATHVVDELRLTLLGPPPSIDETTPEVYDLYLRATHIGRNLIGDSYPRARQFLEQAVAMDPDYLPVRGALDFIYRNLVAVGGMNRNEAQPLIDSNFEAIVSRWPDRPVVSMIRAQRVIDTSQDYETAARYFQRALAAGPETLSGTAVRFMLALNRPELAIEMAQHLVERDRLSMLSYINLMDAYFLNRQFDRVEEVFESARELNLATSRNIRSNYGLALMLNGRFEAALSVFEEIGSGVIFEGRRLFGRAIAFYRLGRAEEFAAALAAIEDNLPSGGPVERAIVLANTGDPDSALEMLNSLPALSPTLLDSPMLDAIRDHSGWPALAEKAGVWPVDPRDSIEFEVSLPE